MAWKKDPNGGPDVWDPSSPENENKGNFITDGANTIGKYASGAWDMMTGKNKADLTTPGLSTIRPDEERALGLQSRDMQGEYGNLLRAQMSGSGPSVAQAQLAQGREAAIRGATAAAASARGANAALAGRSAAQGASRVGMQAARDASLIRAQEQLAAQQQFGALASAQRGQDIQSRQISAAEQQAQLNAQVTGMQTRAQVGEGEASRGQLFGGAAMLGLGSISDPDMKTNLQPLDSGHHYSPPETKMNMAPLGSQPAYNAPSSATPEGFYTPQQYGALTQASSMTGAQAGGMQPQGQQAPMGLDKDALAAQNAQSAGWVAQAQQQAQAQQGSAGGGLMSMGLGMLGSDPALKDRFMQLGMSPEQAHAEASKYSGGQSPAPSPQPRYSPNQYNAIQAAASGQENIPLPPGSGPPTNPYEIDRDLMGAQGSSGAPAPATSAKPMTKEGTTTSFAREAEKEGGLGAGLQAFGSMLGGGKFDALMKAKKEDKKPAETATPDVSTTPAAQPAYSPQGYAEDVKRGQGQLAQNPYPYQKYGQPPPNPYEGEGEPVFVPDRKAASAQAKGEPSKGPVAPAEQPRGLFAPAAQPAPPGQPPLAPGAPKPPTARFPDLVQAAAAVQPAAFQYKEDAAQAQGVTTEDRVGISAERTPGSLADNPVFAPNVQHTPDGTAVVNVPMQTATLTATGAATARKTLELEQELAALKRASGGKVPSTTQNAVFGDTSLDTREEPRNPGSANPKSVPEVERRAGLSFKEKQEARAQDEKMRSKGDQVVGNVRDDLRYLRPDNFTPAQRAAIDTAKGQVLFERVGQAVADIGAGVNTQRAYKQLYDALQIQAEEDAAKGGKPGEPVRGVLVTPEVVKRELKRRGINPKRVPRPDEVSL